MRRTLPLVVLIAVDASGAVIASARFEPPKPHECLRAAAGVASLPVSIDVVRDVRGTSMGSSAVPYRAEARLGGAWRPVQFITSGCFSIE